MAGDVTERTQVRIWDLPTRLFHWLLVFAVIVEAKTGFFGPANSLDWHVWAGYAIAALLAGRLIWGLYGSEYSRADRLFSALRHLPEHIGGLLRLKPKHYAGHNPAGSLMILGLILVLLALVATGLVVLGGTEKQGLLAGITPYDVGHLAKGAHQVLAYSLMAMVVGHLVGVATEMLLLRVPLIRGMITGWLPKAPHAASEILRPARPMLAALSIAFSALVVTAVALPLSTHKGLGVPAPVSNVLYVKECGACHWSFHPSLLPRKSWALIMGSLDQHFGEDASLSAAAVKEISAYLDANAAETADTEPANRLRGVSEAEPMRITATPFWRHQHDELPPQVFRSAKIKSKANCAACHRDALTGRFDDQNIDIPDTSKAGETQ